MRPALPIFATSLVLQSMLQFCQPAYSQVEDITLNTAPVALLQLHNPIEGPDSRGEKRSLTNCITERNALVPRTVASLAPGSRISSSSDVKTGENSKVGPLLATAIPISTVSPLSQTMQGSSFSIEPTSQPSAQHSIVHRAPNTTPNTTPNSRAIFSTTTISHPASYQIASAPASTLANNSLNASPSQPNPMEISQANDQSPQSEVPVPQPPAPSANTTAPSASAATTKPRRSAITALSQYATELLERDFGMPGYNPPQSAPLPRRAPPPPLDPVFPSTEFIGTNAQAPMGVNDNNYAQYPLEQALWAKCPVLRKNRIRIYGWINPGMNYGTSVHSNFPMSYIVASRSVHMDQAVLRFERVPDTVQQEHMDWGFRLTNLYGEDYRFTTSKGWFSTQLLKDNNLTGYDPCEAFTELYIPKIGSKKIFDGLQIRVGRYISCPDIEAQLAPDNYLFTHSIMFTVDTYTQTGIQSWLQLNKYWNLMAGFHSGADTAPWTNSTVPTAQFLVRWASRNNKDSVYAGINDLNGLPFQNATNYTPAGSQGKDNLQQVNLNYTHVFNRRFHTVSEMYGLWSRDALKGGTVSDGPVRSFGGGGGPGASIPGYSHAIGLVNYSLFKVTNKDYITLRPIDLLFDPQGWRTGYATTYASGTIGWCHRYSDLLCIRPEIRVEQSLNKNVTPYDNGTRRGQFTFACDLIQRF